MRKMRTSQMEGEEREQVLEITPYARISMWCLSLLIIYYLVIGYHKPLS